MKILELEIHKGINARNQRKEEDCKYMLHIVGNIVDVSTGCCIVGLTIDRTSRKVIKQLINKDTSKDYNIKYEIYSNDKHYDIIKKGIDEETITIEDVMSIVMGE